MTTRITGGAEQAGGRGGILVVVPCSRRKVWDKHPGTGPVAACDAYNSPPFSLNRSYAERFGDRWVILSARYGFIAPEFTIPGPYNVTFKDRSTNPIPISELHIQIHTQQLYAFQTVVALGGKDYRAIVQRVFAPFESIVVAPFAQLPIGKYMQAVKRTIVDGDPRLNRGGAYLD